MGLSDDQIARLGLIEAGGRVRRYEGRAAQAGEPCVISEPVEGGDPEAAARLEPLIGVEVAGLAPLIGVLSGGSLVYGVAPGPSLGAVGFRGAGAGWFEGVLGALAWCHARGWAHGALSPEDVLLLQGGGAVLAHVGLFGGGDPGEDVVALARMALDGIEAGEGSGEGVSPREVAILRVACGPDAGRRPSNASVLRALLRLARWEEARGAGVGEAEQGAVATPAGSPSAGEGAGARSRGGSLGVQGEGAASGKGPGMGRGRVALGATSKMSGSPARSGVGAVRQEGAPVVGGPSEVPGEGPLRSGSSPVGVGSSAGAGAAAVGGGGAGRAVGGGWRGEGLSGRSEGPGWGRRLATWGGMAALPVVVAAGLAVATLGPGWWDARLPSCEADGDCEIGHCSNGSCAPRGFVYLPAGWSDLGQGRIAATGSGVFLAEREVTQAEWRGALGGAPSWFGGCGGGCPVESVNFYEAMAFVNAKSEQAGLEPCYRLTSCRGVLGGGCAQIDDAAQGGHYCRGDYVCGRVEVRSEGCAGFRLPTTQEWDFAALAPHGRVQGIDGGALVDWTMGVGQVDYEGAFECRALDPSQPEGARCGPQEGGLMPPNRWGVRDIVGNVQEWVDPVEGQSDAIEGGSDPVDGGLGLVRGLFDRVAGGMRLSEEQGEGAGFVLRRGRRCDMRGGAWAHLVGEANPSFISRADMDQRFLDVGLRSTITAGRGALRTLERPGEAP